MLDHALADPLWRVHEVHGPAPWLDKERLDEQRRRLLESSYRRLFLNEWVSAEDRLACEEDLAACVVLDGPLAPEIGQRYVVGVDLGLKHDALSRPSATPSARERRDGRDDRRDAGRARPDGGLGGHARRPGATLRRSRNGWSRRRRRTAARPCGSIPGRPSGSMQRLRTRGVRVEEFTFSSASRRPPRIDAAPPAAEPPARAPGRSRPPGRASQRPAARDESRRAADGSRRRPARRPRDRVGARGLGATRPPIHVWERELRHRGAVCDERGELRRAGVRLRARGRPLDRRTDPVDRSFAVSAASRSRMRSTASFASLMSLNISGSSAWTMVRLRGLPEIRDETTRT